MHPPIQILTAHLAAPASPLEAAQTDLKVHADFAFQPTVVGYSMNALTALDDKAGQVQHPFVGGSCRPRSTPKPHDRCWEMLADVALQHVKIPASNSHFDQEADGTPRHFGIHAGMTALRAKMRIAGYLRLIQSRVGAFADAVGAKRILKQRLDDRTQGMMHHPVTERRSGGESAGG